MTQFTEGNLIESWGVEPTREKRYKITYLIVFPISVLERIGDDLQLKKAVYSFRAMKEIFGTPDGLCVVQECAPTHNTFSGWCPIQWVVQREKQHGIDVATYRTEFIPGVYCRDYYQVFE